MLWIGAFKFTQTEAEAIRPLIEHHPFTCWVYKVFSVRVVSGIVGVVEIVIALLMLLSLRYPRMMRYAAISMVAMFVTTLSFLFTTPGMWRIVEGFPVTDFFILKDSIFLGYGLMLFGYLHTSR